MIRIYEGYIPPAPPPDPDEGTVRLTKTDAEDSTPIGGAGFQLQVQQGDNWNNHANGTVTTGSDGQLEVSGLPAGTYRFVETQAVEGYDIDTAIFTPEIFTVAEGGGAQSFDVACTNKKVEVDPQSAGAPAQASAPTQAGADLDALRVELMGLSFEALSSYAGAQGIELGKTTTVKGAVDKIIAALQAADQ